MKTLAPYQIFFPFGLLCAFLAVSVWFIQDLGWLRSPALFIHSRLIAGGFIWSFITGFLMTAIPRMTGTFNATKAEYVFSSLTLFCLLIFSLKIDPRFFYGAHIALILFLIFYAARRLVIAKKPIPVFFSHVGVGMALALAGVIFYFQGHSVMGMHLYHVGGILLLVLGIGTRFFSFLSGLPSVFENVTEKWKRGIFHGCAVLTGLALFMAGQGQSWAYLLLCALMLIYLFAIWQVQRSSDRPSALKYGVRIVAAMLPLSFFLAWLYPPMYVTWFHLLFIGCFSLLTFSVATRVTLAHGAYPTDFEMKSRALWWVVGLIVLALVTRVFYGFTDNYLWRKSWLHFAASFWCLAVLVWCGSYLIKIFKPGPQSKPSC